MQTDAKEETRIKENKKNWIKEGQLVAHREYPSRSLFVDKILKKSIPQLDTDKPRIFTLGVECHWMDDSGKYTKGVFHTVELIPYVKKDG